VSTPPYPQNPADAGPGPGPQHPAPAWVTPPSGDPQPGAGAQPPAAAPQQAPYPQAPAYPGAPVPPQPAAQPFAPQPGAQPFAQTPPGTAPHPYGAAQPHPGAPYAGTPYAAAGFEPGPAPARTPRRGNPLGLVAALLVGLALVIQLTSSVVTAGLLSSYSGAYEAYGTTTLVFGVLQGLVGLAALVLGAIGLAARDRPKGLAGIGVGGGAVLLAGILLGQLTNLLLFAGY
jgi:hypothetical protein